MQHDIEVGNENLKGRPEALQQRASKSTISMYKYCIIHKHFLLSGAPNMQVSASIREGMRRN